MSTLQERIAQAAAHAKQKGKIVTKAEIARQCDTTKQTVGYWFNGPTQTIDGPLLLKAAKYLDVNPMWLAGEKATMTLNMEVEVKGHSNVQRVNNARMLPVLSWVQAGNLTSAGPIEVTDIKEWYPALSDDDCDKCFYLEVKGISNYPDYQEGDFIQIDPNIYPDELVSGDIIVIHNYEGETFKKLIIENNGRRYLQALNIDWKPNIIEFDEDTRLIGIVVDGFRPIGGSKRKRARKH